jgi:hypothetical protein
MNESSSLPSLAAYLSDMPDCPSAAENVSTSSIYLDKNAPTKSQAHFY